MADWEPNSVEDWQISKVNRRIQMKYPGSEVSVTKAEVIAAREDGYSFLEQQKGPNSDGLNLLKESSIRYFPPQAKGMFAVELGNSSAAFGDIRPMSKEFTKDYRASKDPVKVEATVGKHLEMRNQRLGVPYERTGRLTLSGQRETIYEHVPSQQQHTESSRTTTQERVATCH